MVLVPCNATTGLFFSVGLQIIPAIGAKNSQTQWVLTGHQQQRQPKVFCSTVSSPTKKWNLNLVGYNYIDMKKVNYFAMWISITVYSYMKKGV